MSYCLWRDPTVCKRPTIGWRIDQFHDNHCTALYSASMLIDTELFVGVHEVSETLNDESSGLVFSDFEVSDQVMDVVRREVSMFNVHVPRVYNFRKLECLPYHPIGS